MLDVNHPLIVSLIVPLVLVLVMTPLLPRLFDSMLGMRLAAAAIGLALLVSLVLTFGVPVWPAQSGMQKLPLIFLLLLVGGMIVDIIQPGRVALTIIVLTAIVLIALWLGWPQLTRGDATKVWLLLATSLLALISLYGLTVAPAESVIRPAIIVFTALGLAGAGFNASSLALFQVALALTAAVGGFALWNWPRPRLPFLATGVAVGGLGCFALVLLLVLLTGIRPWALLPLLLVFAADTFVRRLPVPASFSRATVEPIYIAAIGIVAAIVVFYLAQSPTSSDDLYYH